MSKPDPIPTAGAVDLDQARVKQATAAAAKKLAQEKREAEALEAAKEYAAAWEKAMRKTFKGIFSNTQRRIFIKDMLRDAERES